MDDTNGENQEQAQFEGLIQGLIDQDYGCCEDFINPGTVSGLRDTINNLSKAGKTQSAGLGKQLDFQKDKLIRGDKIKWLEKNSDDVHEAVYQKKVGNFINYLNATCYTSLNGFESHYANYETKSFYKRHLDQFKNDTGRKYSMVLYLNENWQKEDGGMLSLYLKGGNQRDISPTGGKMVFFKSDEMEHEVHPSFTKDRISITGWLTS